MVSTDIAERKTKIHAWSIVCAVIVGLTALSCIIGARPVVALGISAGCCVFAHWLCARIALRNRVCSANTHLVFLITGMLLKWMIVSFTLVFALLVLHLPAIALLAGVIAGLILQLFMLKHKMC